MNARWPTAVPSLRRVLQGIAGLVLLSAAACEDTTSPLPGMVQPPQQMRPTLGTSGEDYTYAVSTRSGYVYMAGRTYGSLDGPNLGLSDNILRKYDSEGDLLWGRQFGTPNNEWASGVAADASGNVYVVGATNGSIAGSRGARDGLLRKYSASGAVLWTRQFGTSDEDYFAAVAVDWGGNVIVVGWTFGDMAGAGLGNGDAVVRKYAPNGSVLWTRQFGSSGNDQAFGVAIDSIDNVFVVGHTWGAMSGANKGQKDAFVRKFNSAGVVEWTRQFGTVFSDAATGVAVDGTGAAIVVGYTGGVLYGTNYGGDDAFFRRYTGGGALVRTRQFGTAGSDQANGVSVGPANSFFIVGTTDGNLAGALGAEDAWLRKYSSADVQAFTRQFGTPQSDGGQTVAAGATGQIYVGGWTSGAMASINQGFTDAYVRRLDSSGYPEWTDQ
jgi:hypothetical protein